MNYEPIVNDAVEGRYVLRYVLTLALLVPFLALAALACEGEEQAQPTATPTPVASPAPTATATPTAAVPSDVQAIIDAALSGDQEKLLALVGYTTIPCTATSEGIGVPARKLIETN